MKILTLWSAPYAGGASRRFVELVDGLSARGADVVLLSAHDNVGHVRTCMERVSLPQGRLRTVRTRLSSRLFRDVGALVDKYKPEVVFAFGLVNGSLLCPLARERAIPSVLFIRGMEMTPEEYRRVPFACVPVAGALSHELYTRLFRRYAREVFRQTADAVFQNEQQYQAYLDRRLIADACPCTIRFLPNNSNPSWMPPPERFQAHRSPVTIVVANLFWGKGFRVALDAFAVVRSRVPEARLVILGDGPEGDGIRSYAARIGGVTFEGHVPEVHPYFKCARLLVHPTLFEVGSPNIILEAAGWGFPMIVSQEIAHTVGAKSWVYAPHDHHRLAKLWVAALTDEEFYEGLCRESRELGEQYRFDWVRRAQEILSSAAGGNGH